MSKHSSRQPGIRSYHECLRVHGCPILPLTSKVVRYNDMKISGKICDGRDCFVSDRQQIGACYRPTATSSTALARRARCGRPLSGSVGRPATQHLQFKPPPSTIWTIIGWAWIVSGCCWRPHDNKRSSAGGQVVSGCGYEQCSQHA